MQLRKYSVHESVHFFRTDLGQNYHTTPFLNHRVKGAFDEYQTLFKRTVHTLFRMAFKLQIATLSLFGLARA